MNDFKEDDEACKCQYQEITGRPRFHTCKNCSDLESQLIRGIGLTETILKDCQDEVWYKIHENAIKNYRLRLNKLYNRKEDVRKGKR